ncbi:type II secretion system protein N [Brevundimonas sp. TWP2-3-2]|uniref:type II secretion system protein N n=1 Tax=unclassified Brevundimonas TaxID=2622653 RepID=UPI003CF145CA
MSPERRDEIALRVGSVVVVGSLGLALAGLTWRLTGWDDGRSEVAVAESLPPLGGTTPGADADVARIVSLAPFGGGASTSPGGLPSSTLGLVLKGVLMASPSSASSALIAVGEGPATLYGIGQSPAADAVIEEIGIDHVILKVGDGRERLDFPAPVAGPDAAGAAVTPPGAGITVTPAPMALSQRAQAALASASPIASAAAAAADRPAPSVDTGPAPNVAAAAGAAGVTATSGGYRVGPNPSAELRRFGLQPGDVIASVNGQPVGNASSDQQLLESARSSGQARVVVNRNGRSLTLTFPLR